MYLRDLASHGITEDNPANAMTKISPNLALKGIISINKRTSKLE